MGCAIAYQLGRRGLDVVLCERGALGAQSSGRCAGGVRHQFSTELNVRLQLLSVEMLRGFADEVGQPCDFRQTGYLMLLSSEPLARSFRRQLDMWHRLGIDDACWVGPEQARELAPALHTDGVIGATFCPRDGIASPNDVTQGYAAAARRFGAELRTDCEVEGVEIEGGRVVGVTTGQGFVGAPLLINCAGAWAGQLAAMAGVTLPVQPYPRQIFVTEPAPLMTPATPMTIDVETTFYFHPEGQGALFGMGSGGELPSFSLDVDWGLLEEIRPVMERRAPSLLELGIRTAWAGLYEMTPDHQPFVGPAGSPEGLWHVCGFSGHGFQQAPAIGHLVAQLITEGASELDLTAFSPARDLAVSVPEANVI